MLELNTLLVVGGTGFIGGHLVCKAVALGYQTTVLSLHTPLENKKIDGVDYIVADLISSQQLHQKLTSKQFNYVVNLGGYVDHSKYLAGGREVIDAHFIGVQNLIQCLDWGSLRAFVQIGSSDEYGNQSAPQHEGLNEMPISPYSMGKSAVGQMLQMLHRTESFPAVVLRLFLVYGVGQDQRRFLPQVINGCLKSESFATSLGEQLRDFCYVDDIVNGVILAMTSPLAFGEVINLASGVPVRIRHVLEKVQTIIGQGEPLFGKFPYRAGESMALYADISKAKRLLSWEPKIGLDEGLEKTIGFYRAQLS